MAAIFRNGGLLVLAVLGRLPRRHLLGGLIGRLLFFTLRRRRHIAAVNIRLAFPHMPPAQRQEILRRHFIALGEWLMDDFWALSAGPGALRRYVTIENDCPPGSILLVPHFVGLEVALQRLALAKPPGAVGYYYRPIHSAFWDGFILRLRQRFGNRSFSTLDKRALLSAMRHCRRGGVLCYLPDSNSRAEKHTVYVPFLSVKEAATTTALSKIAAAAKAPVVPTLICRCAGEGPGWRGRGGRHGYVIKFLPPLGDFPGDDSASDAARVNALIEEWIGQMPENYYWLHRRFKSGVDGDTGLYD